MAAESAEEDRSAILLARVAVALVQAAALYLLTTAAAAPRSWPATDPAFFDPALVVAAFVPLIVLVGLGSFP